MEKSSVTKEMMLGDAKGKSNDVGIGNNGTKYGEGPELVRNVAWCKCHSGSNRDSRMRNE